MLNDKIIKELRSTTEVEEYYSKNFDFVFDSKFVMAESFPQYIMEPPCSQDVVSVDKKDQNNESSNKNDLSCD